MISKHQYVQRMKRIKRKYENNESIKWESHQIENIIIFLKGLNGNSGVRKTIIEKFF